MSNLLKLQYWFSLKPELLQPFAQKLLMVSIVVFFITSLAIVYFKRKYRIGVYQKLLSRFSGLLIANIIVGLFLLFFNYEMVPVLSARFWFLLWGIMIAIWIFFLYRDFNNITEKKIAREKEREFKKYLPQQR